MPITYTNASVRINGVTYEYIPPPRPPRLSLRRKWSRIRQRERRNVRKELVHAAGCATEGCCVRSAVLDDRVLVDIYRDMGIRIPRSVARRWP